MNITVFGASGGIGSHVVALAAQRGHDVRAVYRATPRTPPPGQAEILIAPDIFDPASATEAIRGAGGFRARRLADGFPEWKRAGLPIAAGKG